jgi:hypothetical protein
MTSHETQDDIIDIDPAAVVDHASHPAPESSHIHVKRNFGLFGVGAAALIAGALGGGWLYRTTLATYLPSDQFQAMAARVDALASEAKSSGQKLDAVVGFSDEFKSQLNAATAQADEARKQSVAIAQENAATKAKLLTLEKSVADVSASVKDLKTQIAAAPAGTGSADQSGLVARLDQIEKELNGLHSTLPQTRPAAAELNQALSDLSNKVIAGASYESEIAQLAKLVPASEGLDVLQSNAAKGVATQQQLLDGLQVLAKDLVAPAEAVAVDDTSWWGYASTMMSGLVTVKTAGAIDWPSVAQRCSGFVGQGKLSDALALLDQHLEALPKPLQDWRLMATKSLSAVQALEKVNQAVAREVAARG